MKRITINKALQNALSDGSLFEIVDEVYCLTHVVRRLGFTSDKPELINKCRIFLSNNEIDTSHFTLNGKPSALLTKECPICRKEFTYRKSRIRYTCSYDCHGKLFSGSNHPNYKTGLFNFRQKALEHYGEWCNRCNFSNKLALEVHHKDRNRDNNNIENLEVLCSNCHSIEHLS